jgi:Protein of unknown function (DUF1236)
MRKNTMRKNTLMIATAVAALTAGSSMAFAQGAPESHRGGAGAGPAAAQSNPAAKSAPAEKMAPGAGGAAQHSEEKGAPANRMGQANEGNKAKETTGQAPKGERNEKMGDERSKSKAGTTGQAPSDQRATPKSDKLKGDAANERNERNRTTTGQGTPDNRNNMENRNTMENRGGTENRGNVSGANRSNTNVTVNLSSEQKTKIHSIIVSERSAPRVEHVDFAVNVGTVVPRGKVKFAPIPTTIVEIEPSWRGFEYFLVGNELVVVDPATLQIVAVLPA